MQSNLSRKISVTEFRLKQVMSGDKAVSAEDIWHWSNLPEAVKQSVYLTIFRECFSFPFFSAQKGRGGMREQNRGDTGYS